MIRRTEIVIEERVRIVRRGTFAKIACAECRSDSWMVTPEEAALTSGISARTIYRWVEEAKIHFRESAAGTLVVCPRSVLEQARTA